MIPNIAGIPSKVRVCLPIRLLLLGLMVMTTACSHFFAPPPTSDPAADEIIAGLEKTNIDLRQFKCLAKLSISSPRQPVQVFRGAIAGKKPDQLRIDLFAPFGGAAAALASDGTHLFIVLHNPRKYYKKGIGDGSLKRLTKIDLTVGELLDLLVGRIPLEKDLFAQMMPDTDSNGPAVRRIDRQGRLRQEIFLDTEGRPKNAIWYDRRECQTLSCEITGRQTVAGFTLPQRIDLADASGNKVTATLRRFEANADLSPRLFVLPPISS